MLSTADHATKGISAAAQLQDQGSSCYTRGEHTMKAVYNSQMQYLPGLI